VFLSVHRSHHFVTTVIVVVTGAMFTETYSRLNIIVCSPWSTSTLVTLVMFMIDGVETSACPHTCFCNTLSHIVYCSRRGLQAIPTGIAPSTVQLNLNGNAFQTPSIERQNFTALTRLEHLYMSECAIERIVVDAFADLTSLQWLDLSNNRIKVGRILFLFVFLFLHTKLSNINRVSGKTTPHNISA